MSHRSLVPMLNSNYREIEERVDLSRLRAEPEEGMPATGDMGGHRRHGRLLQSPAHEQLSCRPSLSLHTAGL